MNANAVDMGAFIAPTSDQLNADDLIAGTRTITVTSVRANEGSAEQPISISFEGDSGKPYKPCKSMRRVMVMVWGADASKYPGRSMTLYCDPNVQFGGMKVGGIRISHMSHLDEPRTMALTATKARRAAFTVQPLKATVVDAATLIEAYERATTTAAWDTIEADRAAFWKKIPTDDKPRVKAASDAARARITKPAEKLNKDQALQRIREAVDSTALGSAWQMIRDSFDEIPVEVDAAHADKLDSLEQQ